MKYFAMAASLGLAFAVSSAVEAAVFTYDITFDGSGSSVDGGSDTPGGSVLNAGDDFLLTLSAAGSDFWRVDEAYNNVFAPLTFSVVEPALRTADIVTNFLLDGAIVATITDVSVNQSYVHIGAQFWTLALGLEFDQVVMDYSLTAIDTFGATTINFRPDIFSGFGGPNSPFYDSSKISYNVSVVPLPATLPLVLAGLFGIGLISRRRRSA